MTLYYLPEIMKINSDFKQFAENTLIRIFRIVFLLNLLNIQSGIFCIFSLMYFPEYSHNVFSGNYLTCIFRKIIIYIFTRNIFYNVFSENRNNFPNYLN